jgi:hypothetical protein
VPATGQLAAPPPKADEVLTFQQQTDTHRAEKSRVSLRGKAFKARSNLASARTTEEKQKIISGLSPELRKAVADTLRKDIASHPGRYYQSLLDMVEQQDAGSSSDRTARVNETVGEHANDLPLCTPKEFAQAVYDGTIWMDKRTGKLRHVPPAPPADRSLEILELTVQLLLAVARAGGRIGEAERRFIEDQVRRRYAYDRAIYNRAMVFCAHYESGRIDLERCLQAIDRSFSLPHRMALVQVAREVAFIGEGVNTAKVSLLSRICAWLGIDVPEVPPQKRSFSHEETSEVDHTTAWLAAMEIEAGVNWTPDLVRRQYYLLTKRYEPARLQGFGLEFTTLAQQRHAAVRAAAEGLLQLLGLKLEVENSVPPPADIRHNPDLDALFGG